VKRPAGVLVFAILNGLAGLLGLAGTGMTLIVLVAGSRPAPGVVIGSMVVTAGAELALIGIAYGLFRLYPWARWVSMGCSGLTAGFVLLGVAGMAIGFSAGASAPPVGMLVFMVVVYGGMVLYFGAQMIYMLLPRTGEAFRAAAARQALRRPRGRR
jgi:hypothetical protein